MSDEFKCPVCKGNGRVEMLEHCSNCGGTGDRRSRRELYETVIALGSVDEQSSRTLCNTAATYDGMLGSKAGCERIMVVKHEDGGSTDHERFEHIRWMCHQIHEFVDDGRIEKANRWIGFIQGVLFHIELFTLEELKDHNRK